MVEHQPRLLGSRVRFPAGAFANFSVSAKASLPISLSLSLSPFPFSFPSSSFPFLFLSLSFSLRPFVCAKKAHLRIYPINYSFFFCCLLENGWGNPVETSCLATLTAGVVRKKY